jgi:anti-sigma factor RsiW
MHLTDEQLNEYLDHEGDERARVEAHLASCADCAERLATLQVLFDTIASLPEAGLARDLTAPILRRVSGRVSLPRSLRLTVVFQFVVAIGALVTAAPFVMRFLTPYLSNLQLPSLMDLLLQFQAQQTAWIDLLSQFQLPFPEIPGFELSSLVIMLTVAGVSILWLLGNGLLLRNQIK